MNPPQPALNMEIITNWGIETYARFNFQTLSDQEYAEEIDKIRAKYDLFYGDHRFRICPLEEAAGYVKKPEDLFLISFRGNEHTVICLYEKRGLYCFGAYSDTLKTTWILSGIKFHVPKAEYISVRLGVDYSSLGDPESVSYTRHNLNTIVSTLAAGNPYSSKWGHAFTGIVGCSSEAARIYDVENHVAVGLNISGKHVTHLPSARTVCIMKRWSKISKDVISGDFSFVLTYEDVKHKDESAWKKVQDQQTKEKLTSYSAAKMLAIINSKDKKKKGAGKEKKVGFDSEVKGGKAKEVKGWKGTDFQGNQGKSSKGIGTILEGRPKGGRDRYSHQKCSLADILLECPGKKMGIYAIRDLDDTIIDTAKLPLPLEGPFDSCSIARKFNSQGPFLCHKSRGVAQAMLAQWEVAAKDLHVASNIDYDEEVEHNAQRIEEHQRKYDRLRQEREDRKAESERQHRKAEAQAAYEKAKKQEKASSSGGSSGIPGNMPGTESRPGVIDNRKIFNAIFDPEILAAMNPEFIEAVRQVANGSANFDDYDHNPRVGPMLMKLAKWYAVAGYSTGIAQEVVEEKHKTVYEEEEEEIVESDVELEVETVEPDYDPPQKMGDPSIEVSEENQHAAQEAKVKALEAVSEGNHEEAIEHLTQAILLNPTSAMMYATRATVYIKMKKPNAAIRDVNAALKINSDSAEGHKSRGMAGAMLGLWEKAAKDLHGASNIHYNEEIGAVLKKVEHNAQRIEEHQRRYDRLRQEREDRKAESERQHRKAEAQAAYEKAKKQEKVSSSGGSSGIPGNMPGTESRPGVIDSSKIFIAIYNDPEMLAAMKNPEFIAAVRHVADGEANFDFYDHNPRVGPMLMKLAKLYADAGYSTGIAQEVVEEKHKTVYEEEEEETWEIVGVSMPS